MNLVRFLVLAAVAIIVSAGSLAAQHDQPQAHHPAGAASKSKPGTGPASAAMQDQMKTMQAMHEKMMAAKTPEEQNALMAEHMKTMQEGMSVMQGMKGDRMKMDPSTRQRMMEMRMDMMQSMMQMMMDRMPAPAAK